MQDKQAAKKTKSTKKAKKLTSDKGLVFVSSSFNNTIVSVTDLSGSVIANSSPGVIGYKGSRKSTAYAATKAAEDASLKAAKLGLREVKVYVRGMGVGRNAAVKGIRSGGLKISLLADKTPIPHGGPTPRKMPRGS